MKIRPLLRKDKAALLSMLIKVKMFTSQEIDVAMELIDIVLKDPGQKDYRISCRVDDQDQPVGYICYGPAPMTLGTFDLYWIAVAPEAQSHGLGAQLMEHLEEEIRPLKGRLVLIDTSSTPAYASAKRLYLRKGYEEVARIPHYYAPGNDRVTYGKRLS